MDTKDTMVAILERYPHFLEQPSLSHSEPTSTPMVIEIHIPTQFSMEHSLIWCNLL